MNCLICGKEIKKGKPIDDAVLIGGISEEGEGWHGYGFICSLIPCFIEFKKRVFKTVKGKELLFKTG